MRVLVNATSAKLGGGASYVRQQIVELSKKPGVDVTVYARSHVAELLRAADSGRTRVVPVEYRQVIRRLVWEQLTLARIARSYDVVYSVGSIALFLCATPQVVTFQNPTMFGRTAKLIARDTYGVRARARLAVLRFVGRASLRRAECSVAISESLRRTMQEDVPTAKPEILLSGRPAREGVIREQPPLAGLPETYVLSVANDYVHKDWDSLLDLFLGDPSLPTLVLVGAPRSERRADQVRRRVDGASQQRVVLWGPEADRDRIGRLYTHSSAYLAHSLLEAYPLTPHEAMAHGVSVIASDIPSHREVCGSEARYYDPRHLEHAGSEIEITLAAPRRGTPHRRVSELSWSDNAVQLRQILLQTAGLQADRS